MSGPNCGPALDQHVGAEDVEQVLELDDLRRGIAEEHVTEYGPQQLDAAEARSSGRTSNGSSYSE